jgi:hypothetical protein
MRFEESSFDISADTWTWPARETPLDSRSCPITSAVLCQFFCVQDAAAPCYGSVSLRPAFSLPNCPALSRTFGVANGPPCLYPV